jgi:RNA polymerase sigma factor (sigma-70 family)
MDKAKNAFTRTRWTLIERLKNWDDRESWSQFFDLYWKLIYSVSIQSGLTADEAEEVVQETVITVAKKIADFRADPAQGSFKGWLLQLTRRRIIDQLRKRPPPGRFAAHRRVGDQTASTATIERVPSPESLNLEDQWEAGWQKNLIDAAIQRVKQEANPKHYRIFYLHVLKQQPAGQVARALNVNIAQVYLAKSRLSRLVREEVRNLERQLDAKPVSKP